MNPFLPYRRAPAVNEAVDTRGFKEHRPTPIEGVRLQHRPTCTFILCMPNDGPSATTQGRNTMKAIIPLGLLALLTATQAMASAPSIQRDTVERLRGGLNGTDVSTMQRQLQNAMTADCQSTGGKVLGFSTETLERGDGTYEVMAELTCSMS
jgi:hypothetical protein